MELSLFAFFAILQNILFVYVLIQLFREEGPLALILGICCCNVLAYLWGWFGWEGKEKMPVMIAWTVLWLINGTLGWVSRDAIMGVAGS
ncbi:MAG: hypothetical protein RLY93_14795 [Sumerlaeia bacterium]